MFGPCRFSARRKKPGQDNQAESEKRQVADPSSSTAMTSVIAIWLAGIIRRPPGQ
jgi:hypothetical protein